MSDEEYYEEEEVSNTSKKGDGNFLKARQEAKKGELDEQLREYINEWRKQRSKEEEELKRLKEKQAKRKEIRAEQEKKLAQQKKEEEERLRKEEAEKKAKEAEEKRKRLEEAEKKRQAMMQAQKDKQSSGGAGKGAGKKGDGGMANVQDARREMTKTKEQLEEEKKISLSIRIRPLELDDMDTDSLKSKASELWDTIVRLETEKYDLEERQRRQDYDLKELKERQRQQNKQKAIKLGLDPEALTGKYPPKIRMYSKYERRTDTRTYEDRRKLYEGGWDVLYAELLEKTWKEKMDEWSKRPKAKLPKWFGERPGKKPGDPESPDDEEDGPAEAPPGVEEDEPEEPEGDEEEFEEEAEEEGEEEEEEEGEEGEGEEGEEGEGEDRKRKLKKTKRKLSAKAIERKLANGQVMVSCSQCDAYSCFENEGQDEEDEENENAYKAQTLEELDQQVAELIEQLGECQETESVMGDIALSVGAQCTAEGDGVELAVFANEECTWLVPGKSASSILPMYDEDGNSLKTAMSSVETYIKQALTESVSCQAIEYYSPDENGDDEEEDNNEDEENEASEYCQGVFDEETVSWSNCVADGEEEAEEEQQDDEVDYSWVSYDIKNAEDVGTVCYTLSAMDDETRASTGHVYDADTAGSWYERNKKGQIITGDEAAGMSGGAIFAITVFVLAVVGGAAYVLMKKKTGAAKTDYQGGEMS